MAPHKNYLRSSRKRIQGNYALAKKLAIQVGDLNKDGSDPKQQPQQQQKAAAAAAPTATVTAAPKVITVTSKPCPKPAPAVAAAPVAGAGTAAVAAPRFAAAAGPLGGRTGVVHQARDDFPMRWAFAFYALLTAWIVSGLVLLCRQKRLMKGKRAS